ncbi:EF-hand domain-containing protein [Streptomyces sp. NPDC018019]|uniref:EF-hand domain-containing protein n=1 Tax=Streptomyces sp. NPDC018019 TaxID=3365030 RepID=UPI0037ABCEFF
MFSGMPLFEATAPAPMSDIRRRKLNRMFEVLDSDHAGLITEEGSLRLGRAFAEAAGSGADARRQDQLAATAREIWREYDPSPDATGVRQLDQERFAQEIAIDLVRDPDKVIRLIGSLTNVLFGMLDRDGDGRIRKDDTIPLAVRFLGISEEEATTTWERFDATGQGHLTYATCLKAFTEYVVSEDPQASGNWVFGHF